MFVVCILEMENDNWSHNDRMLPQVKQILWADRFLSLTECKSSRVRVISPQTIKANQERQINHTHTFLRASSIMRLRRSISWMKKSSTLWLKEFCRFPKYSPILCLESPFLVIKKWATDDAKRSWWLVVVETFKEAAKFGKEGDEESRSGDDDGMIDDEGLVVMEHDSNDDVFCPVEHAWPDEPLKLLLNSLPPDNSMNPVWIRSWMPLCVVTEKKETWEGQWVDTTKNSRAKVV